MFERAALMGDHSARVVLIAYSDFECPFCAKAAQGLLPRLIKDYVRTGRLLLAYRHMPLDNHRYAQKAAEAAECAGRQGKFWQMHDALFATQNDLGESGLLSRASELRLDGAQFAKCLSGEMAAKVHTDRAEGNRLQIRATPTFMFGEIGADGRAKISQVLTGIPPENLLAEVLSKWFGVGNPADGK